MKKLFTLFILLLLLPWAARAQTEQVSYIYYTENGDGTITRHEDGKATATEVPTTTDWGGDDGTEYWYVAEEDITISSRVTVTGNVHLILADGCNLTVNGGINVSEGNSLTIYAQSTEDKMGKLMATAGSDSYDAGIGGNGSSTTGENGGTITIHGGVVEATGNVGAGIGGGVGIKDSGTSGGSGGEVTIYGGEVNATGTSGSAGIGGGGGDAGGDGGKVTISGGTVNATGNGGGAGIGGGGIGGGIGISSGGSGGEVTISGGTVNATGTGGGAGIGGGGGGYSGTGGTVTISGGTVTAIGGSDGGAGIGGGAGKVGNGGSGGKVTISGGTVNATGNGGGAGIGGGYSSNYGGNGGTITISGGTVNTTGSDGGAGIGGGGSNGGTGGSGGKVTISGGTVNTTGSDGGAGIGGGYGYSFGGGSGGTFSTGTDGHAFIIASSIQDKNYEDSWSGVIFEGDEGKVYGESVTLTTDAAIPSDKTLTVESGKTLTVGTGVTLTVEGTLTNNGAIVNYGTIDGTGTVTGTVLIGLTEEMIEVAEATYTYTGEAFTPEVTVKKEDVTYTIDEDYTVSYSDNINAGTATVTVTPKGSKLVGNAVTKTFTIAKATAKLSFAKKTVSATIGETVENALTIEPTGITVSYSSSDEEVATVDASTGVVTLVGAGTTTITATATGNYTGEASYTLTVTKELEEDEIAAEGETNISIEMGGAAFELTAQVTADDLGTGGTWTWASNNEAVATVALKEENDASGYSLRATTTSTVTSTAIVTPHSVGTATITATYTDSKYTGTVDFTVTITEPEPEEPKPPIYQPSYYNIYVEDVCEGVDITTSKNVVREGGTISLYVEKDTANYTFDNFKVYYKRSYYGPWEVLEEGVQPGEYPIRNIWTHIYIKAEGAEEKEDDPTGMEHVEGVKVYTKDGSLFVQTPQREQVLIISMSGAVVKNEEQIGLKQYHGLQPGIYIVRVGDRTYKLRL